MVKTAAEKSDERLFIDTNVLIYANVEEAPHHQAAHAAIARARAAGHRLWVNRQVLREYLSTMTRPQSFQAVPRATILEQVRLFGEIFEIADDSQSVTENLLSLMKEIPTGGKQVHDTNIVATMIAYDIPALLTNNVQDFARFNSRIRIEPLV